MTGAETKEKGCTAGQTKESAHTQEQPRRQTDRTKSAAEQSAGPKSAAEQTAGPKNAAEQAAGPKSAAEQTAGPKSAAEQTAGPKSAAEQTDGSVKKAGFAKKAARGAEQEISVRRLVGAAVLTTAGFAAAAVVNVCVPQVAELSDDLTIYSIGGWAADRNAFYRQVLFALALLYLLGALYGAFRPQKRARTVNRAPFRFACGIALALWDVAGTKLQLLPRPFFPGPAEILEAFLIDGDFILKNTLYSLRLFTAGFVIGVIFGVLTGILIGWFPKVNYWVGPVLNLCGVIPAVAWMPFALTLFPSAFSAAAFLIIICGWFPIASLTAQGVSSTPKTQLEAARTLGGGTLYQVIHVAIPHAMPQIFTGIGTANAFSFTTLVTAEMMGQPGGLGYYINAAKVWSSYFKVFAAILVMAILFSLIMKVVGMIRDYVLRWQKGTVRQ